MNKNREHRSFFYKVAAVARAGNPGYTDLQPWK